ncbi:tripartite tricarboxylate transporter substrate binding protein [Pseudorhodoplanes sinuspersici]|nr:tripartite tricarboxylate transporter substrate binding protein [Pseudorhodoplanes sinuspersici]RKE67677.1 tripartite-type tricarboxylate transporter receptor subunit TctC [Pseudorhodoplanes sinuspersici]
MFDKKACCIIALMVSLLVPVTASAQGSRNIELIVPFPAGGVTDLVARILSERLSKDLDQTIVVINRDGAGGTIGATATAVAAPDGVTLGFSAMGVITGRPHLRSDLRYNVNSFDYICQVAITPTVIVVSPESPYRSLKDLFDQARQTPDKLTYGHPGHGSIPHLQMLDLSSRAGVTLTSVPFRGDAPARTALIGKHIDIQMSGDAGGIGNMRALAIIARERTPSLPDVPTTNELGFGEGFATPFGLYAPKGVPAAALTRLRKACADTVASQSFRAAMTKSGQTVDYFDGPEFAARMEQVSRLVGDLVEKMPALKN